MESSEILRVITNVGTFGFSIYVALYLLTKTTVAFEKLTEAIIKLEEKMSTMDRILLDIQSTTHTISNVVDHIERKD